MISDSLLSLIDEGRLGLNQGYTTGIEKLDAATGGVLKGLYTLIVAGSGVGKSSLALYSYVFKPLMEHLNDDDFKVYYFSLEMSAEMVLAKLLCMYIFETFKVRLSVDEILSRKKGYIMNDNVYSMILSAIEWSKTIENKLIIYDKSLSAETLYSLVMQELKKQGTFTETETRKIYTPNNNRLIFEVVIDHISLVTPSKGRDLKREIDLVSAMLITLRNMCKISPTVIQQINREASTMDRRKAGLSDIRLSDAADSANPSKDCEIMIGVFSPHKERLNSYMGYDIRQFQDNFRAIQILKARYSQSDLIIPCSFFGDINIWHSIPKPEDIYDYGQYIDPNYLIHGSNDQDDTKEEKDKPQSNLNFVL